MTSPVGLPPYSLAPTTPTIGSASFSVDVQNFFAWQVEGATGANVAGLAQSCVTNATSANESAVKAAAAAAGANVELWDIAHNDYPVGRVVISPAALLAGAANVTYVCKAATGTTHIDPYSDPAHWSIFTVSGGVGGAVYTTSTTLTSSSPFAISISGGAGVWLKLPDATTLSTGIRHAVRNTGDNDLTLIDASGAHIGFIRPQSGATIALSDNSTAAGKWAGDWESVGITADLQFGAAIAGLQNVKQIIQLDATRTMILTGGSSGQNLVAAIYDTSTQLLGAPTLIRAAMYGAMAVKTAVNQVLCVAFDGGNPGTLYASVLSISGTVINPTFSSVPAAITGTFASAGSWVSVGGVWCFSYANASYGIVRAITISGTTPSIGAEQSAAASGAPRLYVSDSILRAVRVSNASTVICTPYSISGNTLTAGTAASTTTAANESAIRSLQYSSGDIGVLHANGGYYVESIFKLTSTTEAVLSTNIRSHGTLTASSITTTMYDYTIVDATKIQFACVLNSDYSVFSTNIIVNNSGNPSAGTALDYANITGSYPNATAANSVLEVVCATGERGFIVSYHYTYSYAYACNLMLFDSSGLSPVRTKVFNLADKIPLGSILPYSLPKSTTGILNGQLCMNSRGTFNFLSIPPVEIGTPSGIKKFVPNSASVYMLGSNGAQIPYKQQPLFRAVGSVRGENNQTTWAVTPLTTAAEGSLGVALQRIEVAQI